MCTLCLTEKRWIIKFIHDNNYLNKKSELINLSRDEFDSISTLYKCIMFSKIYFGDTLSYIGISELACNACQQLGLYVRYSSHMNKFSIMLQTSLFCFRYK